MSEAAQEMAVGTDMTMREKMARAMYEEHYPPTAGHISWEKVCEHPPSKAWHMRLADAGLDALLGPTQTLLDAPNEYGPATASAEALWQLVRDAKAGK